MLWLIPILLLLGGLLLTACGKKEEPPEEDGGFQNNTNYDAPKVIKSTEIVAFSCDFSAKYLDEATDPLEDNAYTLTASLEDGAVKGCYEIRTFDYQRGRFSFQAEPDFLEELEKLVQKHDLPQHNGLSYQVYGLPEDCGAFLSITYASGETVYASNNQSCFFSVAAMEDLERLFRQQVEPEVASMDAD